MNTIHRPFLFSIALLTATAAFAAPKDPGRIFIKIDLDGNGKLSAQEMIDYRMPGLKKFAEKKGWNQAELDKRIQAQPAQMAKMIKKFDKDGDGALTQEEWIASFRK